jgi:hypothetical protein
MKHLGVTTSKHKDGFKGILSRIPLIRPRAADNLELRHTLDGDVNRMVTSTDIGTFAGRIILVADGNQFPAVAAPPAGVAPFVGHLVPLVRPTRVRVLRDEGLVFV